MTYVKFTGSTPYQGTAYEDYLVFFEGDDSDSDIARESINFAIENAQKHDHLVDFSIGENKNFIYLDYLQKCIDNAKWELISEQEFYTALDTKLP